MIDGEEPDRRGRAVADELTRLSEHPQMVASPPPGLPSRPRSAVFARFTAFRRLRSLRGVGVGLGCALLAWALTAAPLIRGVEDWMLDGLFFYRGARPTTARVVIVGLDEPSLRDVKKPLTHLSPELAAVTQHALDGGASAVGIDLFIPDDKDDDPDIARVDGRGEGWSLGTVVYQSGRVVLPVRAGDGQPVLPVRQWWQTKRLLRPETTDFGSVDLDEDGDQFVRRQALLTGDGDDSVPQFALALYARSRGEVVDREPGTGRPRVGGRLIPVDPNGRLRVNYAGPPGSFPVVPFRDALAAAREGKPFPVDVRGAVVIVGVTARTMQDYHATPYANHYARYESSAAPGRMSGAELHSHVYATIHDGAHITTPWWLSRIPLLLVFGVLLGSASARLSLEWGFVLAVVHHFAWKTLALAAFSIGYRVEVVAVLTLGVLVYAATFLGRWRRMRRMLGVAKSEAVIRALEADTERVNPGGEERVVTVLFADIRKFTDFSEQHAPAEVVALQNAFFGAIVPCIEAEGGTVVCYMGDGLMALFGAPATLTDHAARAVRSVTAMIRAVHARREQWAALDRAGVWKAQGGLRVGVGVHTGPVVVGAVGSPGRLDYTATGDVVNAAARLEGANKEFGTEVLVSGDTLGRVPSEERAGLSVGNPVQIVVKGKKKDLTAYPLTAG